MEIFEQPVPAGQLEALRQRLVDAAVAEGLVDVAYRRLDSPVGPLLVAATERGVVRLAFAVEDGDQVLQELTDRISPRVLPASGQLDQVARELEEYFQRRRRRFELPLDLRLVRGFRLDVLHQLSEIGYGHTKSYAQVAAASGNPAAVRAVGTACALNPVPLLVPCHRVVRSDGSYGGYRGGAPAKGFLLGLEADVNS